MTKRICQGGNVRCMDCRCGKPTQPNERSETPQEALGG